MNFVYLAFAAVAGILIAVQAPVNASLGKEVGPFSAAVLSFAGGFLIALFAAIATRQLPSFSKLSGVPAWQLTGGIYGAALVILAIVLVPKIGVTQMVAATMFGQIVAALAIDHFGIFGVPMHAISWTRLLAIPVLGLGLWLAKS